MLALTELVADRVTAETRRVLPDLDDFDPQLRRSEHADFQANGLLAVARRVGRSPRELATAVAAEVAPDGVIARCVAAGPGFLNLTVSDAALLGQVARRRADPRLGVGTPQRGVRTIVEYSGPNVAKEMHVGHLRSTIIGDALARILDFLGGTVLRQNHVGDWGTNFGMLIQQLAEEQADGSHAAGSHAAGGDAAMSGLDRLYRDGRARFEADPAFVARARRRVVALQSGDPATLAAWRAIVAESTRYFNDVYARLGVLLTDADLAGESRYNPALAGVAAELERAGVARVSDGALCAFSDDVTGPDGEPVPLIIRKGDGGFGYAATDLAALRHRVDSLHADRILYVVDARQALHFRMVLDTARRAGWLPDSVAAVHLPFGTVLGPDGRPFKTRAGVTVRLVDLLTEAVDRARAVVTAKNPGLAPAAVEERARQVGIGAVKYADLSNGRTRDYPYDPDRMLSLTGNTGVYLQYAHARIRSLLRRAGQAGRVSPELPLDAAERRLALHLDGFADVLAEVATSCEPHRLCGYLYGLAQAYTGFYERCPVLSAPADVRDNRLALSAVTGEVLRTGLDLLGIAAPEEL